MTKQAARLGRYDRAKGIYWPAVGEHAYHATWPHLLERIAHEGLTKNSVSHQASRAEFEQPDAVYFSNANGYHSEYGVVLLRFLWPQGAHIHLAMPDAPLIEGRIDAVESGAIEVATNLGWLGLRQALEAHLEPYNLDEQEGGQQRAFPEIFFAAPDLTREQPFLDDWLVGRMEPRSQELAGAAAGRFGLSLGALPTSADAEAALESLYARTQAVLAAAHVEQLKLYRGLEGVAEVQAGAWQEGPLSSWTANAEMARAHAQGELGRVISTVVGRERVVGFFGTGMGSAISQEYVISGGALEIEVEDLAEEGLQAAGL
jgi:hypothetical protein